MGIYYFMLRGAKFKEREGAARTIDLGTVAFAGIAAKLASLTIDFPAGESPVRWLLLGAAVAVVHVFAPRKVEAFAIGILILLLFGRFVRGDLSLSYTPGLILWMVFVVGTYVVVFFVVRWSPVALMLPPGSDRFLPSLEAGIVGLGALVAVGVDFFDPIWGYGIERMFAIRLWTVFFFAAGLVFVALLTIAPTFTATVLGAGLVASEVVIRGSVLAIPGAATPAESAASVAVLLLAGWFLLVRMFGGRLLGRFLPAEDE